MEKVFIRLSLTRRKTEKSLRGERERERERERENNYIVLFLKAGSYHTLR